VHTQKNTPLRLAIIGDYSFADPLHFATNQALDHARSFLDIPVNYYWIRLSETNNTTIFNESWDGFILPPNPGNEYSLVHDSIAFLTRLKKPTLLTGQSFQVFINLLANKKNGIEIPSKHKLTSTSIIPHSSTFINLFNKETRIELTNNFYPVDQSAIDLLAQTTIDIDAFDSQGVAAIISLKNHPFFIATRHAPQACSDPQYAHPLLYTFIKACGLSPSFF